MEQSFWQRNKSAFFRAAMIFTDLVLIYAIGMVVFLGDTKVELNAFALTLFKNLVLLLCYSFVLSFSAGILSAKKLPDAAKRTLHIVVTYTATIILGLLMTVQNTVRDKIMFAILTTAVFAIIYTIAMLVGGFIKKRRQ